MKICSTIVDLVEEEYHEPQSIKHHDIQELASVLVNIPRMKESCHEELTTTEIDNCHLQFHLGKALTLRLLNTSLTDGKADSNKNEFDNAIQHILDWLKATAKARIENPFNHCIAFTPEKPIAPTWQYLHSAFSTLESLQAISLFLASQSKASKTKSKTKNPFSLSTAQHKQVEQLLEQIETSIHNSARTLKTNLTSSGVLGSMIDVVFGRSTNNTARDTQEGDAAAAADSIGNHLENLPDAETVAELFCAEVKESWEDALDGVLGVKLRRYQ
jgi:N-terminal acetyltransferase B complex non-catalytic subunit